MFDKIITSSSDPAKISATVKGILVAIVPIIMMVTGASEADTHNLINQIVNIVFYGTSLYSAVMVVFGIIRKAYHGRWTALDSQDDEGV